MLVDDISIHVVAGKGGDGLVAFNATKMNLGPTGGDGGRGGSVFLEGVADIGALNALRNKKIFRAENGQSGQRQLHKGENGNDLVIRVPAGTVVHGLGVRDSSPALPIPVEIGRVGERLLIVRGGWGGRGNAFFRSPTNTSPQEATPGKPGQEADLRLELKLIADAGLIGLPNAGKSSLLNHLTRAKSKTASYAFTTLEPHLGSSYGLILADIPGIIEGASSGKGLGIKFLRHIERTKTLFHLISAESRDPVADYQTIREELGAYSKEILQKNEYVLLTKSDLVSPKDLQEKLRALKEINLDASPISILNGEPMSALENILKRLREEKGLT